MGLFGSSKTTTYSSTNVNLEPVTNIDIPLDELATATTEAGILTAQAQEQSTLWLIESEQATRETEANIAQAKIMSEEQIRLTELEEETAFKKAELTQKELLYKKIFNYVLIGGSIFLYMNLNKKQRLKNGK